MIFHELKDLVMIYSSDPNGMLNYDWDKAKIHVWDPNAQKEMNLTFVGSSRGKTPEEFKINFNATYVDDKSTPVWTAFDNFIKAIFPNIDDELARQYHDVFIRELLKTR